MAAQLSGKTHHSYTRFWQSFYYSSTFIFHLKFLWSSRQNVQWLALASQIFSSFKHVYVKSSVQFWARHAVQHSLKALKVSVERPNTLQQSNYVAIGCFFNNLQFWILRFFKIQSLHSIKCPSKCLSVEKPGPLWFLRHLFKGVTNTIQIQNQIQIQIFSSSYSRTHIKVTFLKHHRSCLLHYWQSCNRHQKSVKYVVLRNIFSLS